jgi:hypothetical protein
MQESGQKPRGGMNPELSTVIAPDVSRGAYGRQAAVVDKEATAARYEKNA